jgi:putative transcriptional regulator
MNWLDWRMITEKERGEMSKAGSRILKSVRRARSFARGEGSKGFAVHVPEEVDVRAIRQSLGLTRKEFAARFGFAKAAVQDWEQHRRQPERSARVLLKVIKHEPDAVRRALASLNPR